MKERIPYFVLDKNYNVVSSHNNAENLYKLLTHPDFFKDLFNNRDAEDLQLPVLKTVTTAGLQNIKLLVNKDEHNLNCFVIDDKQNIPGYAAMNSQLREPVSSIFSLIPVIVDNINKDNPDRAVMFLEEISRNTYKLLRSITNIGLVSKIYNDDTGNISVIDFSSLLNSIADGVSTAVNNIKITCEAEDNITIKANSNIMSAAILNLVSNSINYKQDDDVEIIIRLEKRNDNAVFTYIDNSKGIKEECMENVFDAYYSQDPYYDGALNNRLGLGLTIVQEAFRQAGGNILLASEFGKGVKYTASVPTSVQTEFLFESSAADYLLNRYSDIFIQLCDCCKLPSIE